MRSQETQSSFLARCGDRARKSVNTQSEVSISIVDGSRASDLALWISHRSFVKGKPRFVVVDGPGYSTGGAGCTRHLAVDRSL